MAQPAGAEQDYCRTTVAVMHKLTTGHKTVKKKKKKKEHSFCRSKFEFGTHCTSALLYTTVQLQLSIKDTLSVRTFETLTKYVLIRPDLGHMTDKWSLLMADNENIIGSTYSGECSTWIFSLVLWFYSTNTC